MCFKLIEIAFILFLPVHSIILKGPQSVVVERSTPTYMAMFLDQAIVLDELCSSRYETKKLPALSKRL